MQGKIVRWDAARGFGFVKEEITSTELFIHISALNIRNPPPEVGEEIAFETMYNEEKGRTEVETASYLNKNRKEVLELAQAPRKPSAQRRKYHADKNRPTSRPQRPQRARNNYYSRESRWKARFWAVVAIIIFSLIIQKFFR